MLLSAWYLLLPPLRPASKKNACCNSFHSWNVTTLLPVSNSAGDFVLCTSHDSGLERSRARTEALAPCPPSYCYTFNSVCFVEAIPPSTGPLTPHVSETLLTCTTTRQDTKLSSIRSQSIHKPRPLTSNPRGVASAAFGPRFVHACCICDPEGFLSDDAVVLAWLAESASCEDKV
ncbi:hypothetical protein BDP27DRAFT_1343360 [Rhodocollybia butyracea]|uniref:Uncharacterized protein n=1 Tax=Rhodocollybia butyracea TaxID=206335 RepID=A0A9P5PAH2_9AGAR|nr:hypothetical protein BDP27DRAFT_1343360 [Rhodocollybia butyracea]